MEELIRVLSARMFLIDADKPTIYLGPLWAWVIGILLLAAT